MGRDIGVPRRRSNVPGRDQDWSPDMPDVINAELVRTRLSYDPETGRMTWLGGRRRGRLAGCLDNEGYRVIRMDGLNHKAHRLVWLHVHGNWPAGVIDHINGDRDDNRLGNLRDVDNSANQQNKRGGGGTSQHLGVCWAKDTRKWQAQIKSGGKTIYLGQYDDELDAAAAYRAA